MSHVTLALCETDAASYRRAMRHEHAIPLLFALAGAALAGCPGPSTDDAGTSPGFDAAGLDAPGLDAHVPGVDAHVDPSIDAAGLDAPLGEVIPPDDPGAADVRFEISSVERRHPISPWIYGSNQVEPSAAHGESMGRLGGNRWTAYNWETNASNAGSDYLYQNDTYLGGGSTPGGAVAGPVSELHGAGMGALITVPIAGWVAADTSGPTDPGGADRGSRFFEVRASGGTLGGPPNTGDRAVYTDEYVDWARRTLMPTGTVFFSLDNEPDLWSATHSEIHPEALTYAEIIARNTEHATAITAVVPDAVVLGPVSYGYAGYLNLQSAPDAGGRDFLETYLDAMRAAETTAGRRLVDALDVHWYPEAQGGGQRITGEGTSPEEIEARVQAPRSLWDPSYVESSWITDCCSGGAIRLIPWLRDKIDAHYPGTRIAITEYDYGAAGHISGGIAQADVLGVFADEDVFAAMWWQLAEARSYVDGAFEMYRDFDGAGGRFGDTSIASSSSDVARGSIHASVDASSADRMVLVAINRSSAPITAGFRVEHTQRFGTARVFRLTAASASPVADGTIAITLTNAFTATLPGHSVTTLELVR